MSFNGILRPLYILLSLSTMTVPQSQRVSCADTSMLLLHIVPSVRTHVLPN